MGLPRRGVKRREKKREKGKVVAGKKKNCFGRKIFQRKKFRKSGPGQSLYGHTHTLKLTGRLCCIFNFNPFPIFIFPVFHLFGNLVIIPSFES
jgi:hypothetical protein